MLLKSDPHMQRAGLFSGCFCQELQDRVLYLTDEFFFQEPWGCKYDGNQ